MSETVQVVERRTEMRLLSQAQVSPGSDRIELSS